MKARKNFGRRTTFLRCDLAKDVAHEQHTGFDKKIQVNIGRLSNSLRMGETPITDFHTCIAGVRESVGT